MPKGKGKGGLKENGGSGTKKNGGGSGSGTGASDGGEEADLQTSELGMENLIVGEEDWLSITLRNFQAEVASIEASLKKEASTREAELALLRENLSLYREEKERDKKEFYKSIVGITSELQTLRADYNRERVFLRRVPQKILV